MKKILLTLLFFNSIFCHSQEKTNSEINPYQKTSSDLHEISFNAQILILGNFQLTYENLFSERITFGATLSIPFDDYVSWRLNYGTTAFTRYYFGDDYASGIYAEGFLSFNNFEVRYDEVVNFAYVQRSTDVSNLAIGFSFGKKIYSNGGSTIDIFGGIGRNLFKLDDNYGRQFSFIPRGGIYFGYLF